MSALRAASAARLRSSTWRSARAIRPLRVSNSRFFSAAEDFSAWRCAAQCGVPKVGNGDLDECSPTCLRTAPGRPSAAQADRAAHLRQPPAAKSARRWATARCNEPYDNSIHYSSGCWRSGGLLRDASIPAQRLAALHQRPWRAVCTLRWGLPPRRSTEQPGSCPCWPGPIRQRSNSMVPLLAASPRSQRQRPACPRAQQCRCWPSWPCVPWAMARLQQPDWPSSQQPGRRPAQLRQGDACTLRVNSRAQPPAGG